MNQVTLKYHKDIDKDQLQELFLSVSWESGNDKELLYHAILNSSLVISAWKENKLVGLLSAISDQNINIFITYFLVHMEYQNQGIGTLMMDHFIQKSENYHRRILVSADKARDFYSRYGFRPSGTSMFIK